MTPRKARNGSRNHQPNHQPSDYESDLNVSDLAPPPPPPNRTNEELNLSVLRRHYPAVSSILSVAPYAVIYSFPPSTQQWEKIGVEGTLFVSQLSSDDVEVERYAVTVLNRRDLQNFHAELFNEADVEVTQPYIILKANGDNQTPRVFGIWVFSESETSSTANIPAITAQIIQDCAVQAETSRRLAEGKRTGEHEQIHHLPISEQAPPAGEPMGRQLSLRELFGQQRGQDQSNGADTTNGRAPPRPSAQFIPTADTNFFRSSVRPSHTEEQRFPNDHAQPTAEGSKGEEQKASSLLDLFRKAGQDLNKGS
ncbi:MAG: hypothetical protein M4579_000252 [Chaenotheca gracillima]|nr:MAG: hypothetical protein M4579_000252 [Chaenotheca gracillima]